MSFTKQDKIIITVCAGILVLTWAIKRYKAMPKVMGDAFKGTVPVGNSVINKYSPDSIENIGIQAKEYAKKNNLMAA